MSARQEILARIARAHELAPPSVAPVAPAYADVDRSYRDQPNRSMDDVVELLVDRLEDYKALVRTSTRAELATTVAADVA